MHGYSYRWYPGSQSGPLACWEVLRDDVPLVAFQPDEEFLAKEVVRLLIEAYNRGLENQR